MASLFLFTSSDPVRTYYNELYRPQFHFSPEKYHLGEPCALVGSDGNFHLHFLCNPDTAGDENLQWGHATAADLIRWKQLPPAMQPGKAASGKEPCTAASGCAVIDNDNLLGKQTGLHKTVVVFYTAKGCGQYMAWSSDDCATWNQYAGNPVIPYDENDGACSPSLFWHEKSGKWIMLLSRKPGNDERYRGFSFYASTDLIHWEFKSHLAGFHGNPDMVSLRVNNRPDDTRWVVFESNGNYIIGSFDGSEFKPESIRMTSDFGDNYQAPRAWFSNSSGDGRTLQIAWMNNGKWPGMSFTGQMTFPGELSLKKINSGIFLIRQPAKEIELLHKKGYHWENENLIPGINKNLIRKIQGDCLHIKGRFDLKTAESFGLMLRAGKKNPGTELVYNVRRQTLFILGKSVPLEPVDNKIFLEILIDRASVEVYANNGRTVISNLFFNKENDLGYILFCTGGELMVEQLDIFELQSAWEQEKK